MRGHTETIGERFERDRAALLPLPAAPYEACEKISARVSSLSLVRYRSNDDSVPTEYGHRPIWVKGYVHEVGIACASEVIAGTSAGIVRGADPHIGLGTRQRRHIGIPCGRVELPQRMPVLLQQPAIRGADQQTARGQREDRRHIARVRCIGPNLPEPIAIEGQHAFAT